MANDRIVSDVEAFEAAVSQFTNCQQSLQNAYLQMTQAVFTLDSSWNGEASEAVKAQYNDLSKNLQTSDGTIQTAIKDIQMVIAGHEEVTQMLEQMFQAMADTTDPFSAG